MKKIRDLILILEELWELFEDDLFLIKSSKILFNQYFDKDLRIDLPNAPKIRKNNLKNYLKSFSEKPGIIIVGEAAGPWGCRFSGVPFTSEKQLIRNNLPFSGSRSSKDKPSIETKMEPPYTSNSAEAFWKVLKPYHPKFFVWDCVPFHPHYPEDILSVKTPKLEEIMLFSKILKNIMKILEPDYVVSVGKKAEVALDKIGTPSKYIRHPSRGGSIKFKNGLTKLLKGI